MFFDDNTLRTRRNLRSHVERRSLCTNEQFESQFRNVKEQLDSITADIKEMDSCCKEMTTRLKVSICKIFLSWNLIKFCLWAQDETAILWRSVTKSL
eukprot:Seg3423.2 transcript_id=Seg3423.2/GoldUCD/mRNA.D3Y31 product="hypothetical protein" protein_id=Seg3423.2/GoldUCD/D3Y31